MSFNFLKTLGATLRGRGRTRTVRRALLGVQFQVDGLEQRLTPTVTATFSAATGVLQLIGDYNADWMAANVSGSQVYFNGTSLRNLTGYSQLAIPLTALRGIDFGGRTGNDTIEYSQSATFTGPVRMFGEGGDDRFNFNLNTMRTARMSADGGDGRDTCDIPSNLINQTGTFWTNAELGAINSYAAWNTGKSARATPYISSDTTNRSTDLLMRVIRQFNVVSNPRYTPANGLTYCNIFAWDVTSALGAEIPHWTYSNGDIAAPFATGASEMTANATVTWLANNGARYGWTKVTASQAQTNANQGKPAIAIWKNPTGASGHVAAVRYDTTSFDATRGPAIAQAGATNTEFTYVKNSFTTGFAAGTVQYWMHS
jgi:hypothetical protein